MRIGDRIYQDYFAGNRLKDYTMIEKAAVESGYETHSLISFYDLLLNSEYDANKKYLINRHDIDTDVKTARTMFLIEKELGVKSSFYFRLSTMSYSLMKEIEESGSEASYHYEEIAAVAKENGLQSGDILSNMSEIKQRFLQNYDNIKRNTECQMRSIASHGDFANVKLGISNLELVDEDIRNSRGIAVEAYDEKLMKYVTSRIADLKAHEEFVQEILDSIKRQEKVIYFLTHPRNWNASLGNIWVDIRRITDGAAYIYKIKKNRNKRK